MSLFSGENHLIVLSSVCEIAFSNSLASLSSLKCPLNFEIKISRLVELNVRQSGLGRRLGTGMMGESESEDCVAIVCAYVGQIRWSQARGTPPSLTKWLVSGFPGAPEALDKTAIDTSKKTCQLMGLDLENTTDCGPVAVVVFDLMRDLRVCGVANNYQHS